MADSFILHPARRPPKHRGGPGPIDTPERLIGQHIRRRVLVTLSGVDSLSFNELHELVGGNAGNLSHHTRRLAEWGYVEIEKRFVNRLTRTEYRLTPAGRRALDDHLALCPPGPDSD